MPLKLEKRGKNMETWTFFAFKTGKTWKKYGNFSLDALALGVLCGALVTSPDTMAEDTPDIDPDISRRKELKAAQQNCGASFCYPVLLRSFVNI